MKGWKRTVRDAFPETGMSKETRAKLDQEGRRGNITKNLRENEESNMAVAAWDIGSAATGSGDGDAPGEEVARSYTCPVCTQEFQTGNALQFHYEAEHSVRDPEVVAVISRQCKHCKKCFARKEQVWRHVCEANKTERRREETTIGGWFPVVYGPPETPPEGWWIATDGSGQTRYAGEVAIVKAGWGAPIWKMPIRGETPDYLLHGPVLAQEWDRRWLGAREKRTILESARSGRPCCGLWVRLQTTVGYQWC